MDAALAGVFFTVSSLAAPGFSRLRFRAAIRSTTFDPRDCGAGSFSTSIDLPLRLRSISSFSASM